MFLTILEFNILDIPKSHGRILAVCHGRKGHAMRNFTTKHGFINGSVTKRTPQDVHSSTS